MHTRAVRTVEVILTLTPLFLSLPLFLSTPIIPPPPTHTGRFTSFIASPNGTSTDSNVKDALDAVRSMSLEKEEAEEEESVAAQARDPNKVGGEPAFVSALSKPQVTPTPGCGACVVS